MRVGFFACLTSSMAHGSTRRRASEIARPADPVDAPEIIGIGDRLAFAQDHHPAFPREAHGDAADRLHEAPPRVRMRATEVAGDLRRADGFVRPALRDEVQQCRFKGAVFGQRLRRSRGHVTIATTGVPLRSKATRRTGCMGRCRASGCAPRWRATSDGLLRKRLLADRPYVVMSAN